jgi:hypothetical protein
VKTARLCKYKRFVFSGIGGTFHFEQTKPHPPQGRFCLPWLVLRRYFPAAARLDPQWISPRYPEHVWPHQEAQQSDELHSTAGAVLLEGRVVPWLSSCVRTSKYPNNMIEQDHRRIKQRLRPILGAEELSDCIGSDRRDRISREDQDEAIQNRQVGRPEGNDVGVMAGCVGCVINLQIRLTR